MEESKRKGNLACFRDRSFDSGVFSESPQFERKRLKSRIVDETIKMECDKNRLIEDEIKVISKEEDLKIQEKLREYEKALAEMERERGDSNQAIAALQGKVEEDRGKIDKLREKNKLLKEQVEALLSEKRGLCEEIKELKAEVEALKRRVGLFEKKVVFHCFLSNFLQGDLNLDQKRGTFYPGNDLKSGNRVFFPP